MLCDVCGHGQTFSSNFVACGKAKGICDKEGAQRTWTISTKNLSVDKKARMSYESYAQLRGLVQSQIVKLENDFRIACNFIPAGKYNPNEPSGIDKAHRIFTAELSKLNKIQEELHFTVAESYKDHPNKEMRKFWGLTE